MQAVLSSSRRAAKVVRCMLIRRQKAPTTVLKTMVASLLSPNPPKFKNFSYGAQKNYKKVVDKLFWVHYNDFTKCIAVPITMRFCGAVVVGPKTSTVSLRLVARFNAYTLADGAKPRRKCLEIKNNKEIQTMQKCNKSVRLLMIVFLVLVFILAGIGLVACNGTTEEARGIQSTKIENGHLIVVYTDGTQDDLGDITSNSESASIKSVDFDESTGKLTITLTDGTSFEQTLNINGGNSSSCAHEDMYDITVREEGYNDARELDCTAGAKILHVCENEACGYAWVEELEGAQSEHVWAEKATTIAATCTSAGYTAKFCTNEDCKQHDTATDEVAALGHEWKVAPASIEDENICENGGYGIATCSRCSKVATQSDYEADSSNEVLASFVSNGTFSSLKRVAPAAHQVASFTLQDTSIKSTDIQTVGSTFVVIGKCSVCLEAQSVEVTLNTKYFSFSVAEGKSCTASDGGLWTLKELKDYPGADTSKVVLTSAGSHLHSGELLAEGNRLEYATVAEASAEKVYLNDSSASELSCNVTANNGTAICDNCNHSIAVKVAKPHTKSVDKDGNVIAGTLDADMTDAEKKVYCEKGGELNYVCSVCKTTFTDTVSAPGHQYVYTTSDGTNKNTKKFVGTCSVCSNVVTYDNISSYELKVTKEATCESEGTQSYVLTTEAGETIEAPAKNIAKLIHKDSAGNTYEKYNESNPYSWTKGEESNGILIVSEGDEISCKDGTVYKVGYICSLCNKYCTTYVKMDHTKATADAEKVDYVCDLIAALGEDATDEAKNKIISDNTYTCTVCEQSVAPSTDHNITSYVVVSTDATNKTTTVNGLCEVCGEVDSTVEYTIASSLLSKAGKTEAATCTEEGANYYYGVSLDSDNGVTGTVVATIPTIPHQLADGTKLYPTKNTYQASASNQVYLNEDSAATCDATVAVDADGAISNANGIAVCSVCSKSVKVLITVPHTFEDSEEHPQIKTAATSCTDVSTVQRWCKTCSQYVVDSSLSGTASGHKYAYDLSSWDEKEGTITITCSNTWGEDKTQCASTWTASVKALTDKSWTKTVYKAATCLDNRVDRYTCEVSFKDGNSTVKLTVNYDVTVSGTALGHDKVYATQQEWYELTISTEKKTDENGKEVEVEVKTYYLVTSTYCANEGVWLTERAAEATSAENLREGLEIVDVTVYDAE